MKEGMMGLRLRLDGTLVCAAEFPEEPGDIYIDHREHYEMAVKGMIETQDGLLWTKKNENPKGE